MIPIFQINPGPHQTYASRSKGRIILPRANARRRLPLFIFISLCSGIPGAVLCIEDEWYNTLQKPPWEPPLWVFAVVWPIVYIITAVAAWRAWAVRTSMLPWMLQWLCNILSMPVLYLGQSYSWAFVLLVLVLVFIYWGAWSVSERDMVAAVTVIPFLLWVSIEATLLYMVWDLNSQIVV